MTQSARPSAPILWGMELVPTLIEFPADDPERARRFWAGLLGTELRVRQEAEGEGWQTPSGLPAVGVHLRGRGPGDSFSLPYFSVADMTKALERVKALGGSVIHPGEKWAVCKDSEGTPFGLAHYEEQRERTMELATEHVDFDSPPGAVPPISLARPQ